MHTRTKFSGQKYDEKEDCLHGLIVSPTRFFLQRENSWIYREETGRYPFNQVITGSFWKLPVSSPSWIICLCTEGRYHSVDSILAKFLVILRIILIVHLLSLGFFSIQSFHLRKLSLIFSFPILKSFIFLELLYRLSSLIQCRQEVVIVGASLFYSWFLKMLLFHY